ncbi:uncharacterized protein YutE (UPF0331/DUF86 family) [Aureibacillus halotolerans]|uniref:Uncharacterized protein YutE (UPF0331/DUF86 family) n=1 Tax=Aureibacillus halotolerans TaxID=1508390 RepID=A0A4R6U361_9BACI|nr:uncharacterized protein YutE (UPF0331/DUF86 family) [Aureibacillus halotolerans]
MYFVDRTLIEEQLTYIERLNDIYRTQRSWVSDIDQLAFERMVQGWIEAVVDTGNLLIDGYFMRDPGSYEDIIAIMEDEQVVSKKESQQLLKLLEQRGHVVRQFYRIDSVTLQETVKASWEALQSFPEAVRSFMKQETSVHAFKAENKQDKDREEPTS